MTKAEIVEMVHRSSNLSKSEATELTELVFETIKQSLERGEGSVSNLLFLSLIVILPQFKVNSIWQGEQQWL